MPKSSYGILTSFLIFIELLSLCLRPMKGVVIAGGQGTRLYPLTQKSPKALLPVSGKPMISYPIKTLVDGGIDEILIVTSGPFAGEIINYLKDGKDHGLKRVEFVYKEGGTLAALSAAEGFVKGENMAVICADNILKENIAPALANFKDGATVFLKKVEHPEQHAVVVLNEKNKIIEIEEKPLAPKSNLVTVGLFLYDAEIFNIARECKLSARGELEIPDANKIYLSRKKLNWIKIKGFWCDAGTFDGLAQADEFLSDKRQAVERYPSSMLLDCSI